MVRRTACAILPWLAATGAVLAQAAMPPAQQAADAPWVLELSGDMQRTRTQPQALGFIATESPHCIQLDPAVDACYINFQFNGVSSDQYVTEFTVAVNGLIAMRAYGFFQGAFSLPRNSLGDLGLRVACGRTGASGDADPLVGLRHPFTIRAKDSAGQNAANYGAIGCPAFFPELNFANGFEGTP
jgi:hypothetical protein